MIKEIRIYIADLAAYNNGILHGLWVDATLDLDEIQELVDSLLNCSPVENSEEIAIHDYEGFEGVSISEYEGLESVQKKALFILEHGMDTNLEPTVFSVTIPKKYKGIDLPLWQFIMQPNPEFKG